MIVAILYGRSWQGVADATKMLGNAAFASKFHVQDLVEERGASAVGCVKMDKLPIESRQPEPADYVLVFDMKMDTAGMLKGAVDRSCALFNSRERVSSPLLKKKAMKAFFLDATGIAVSSALRASPHAAMLGAFTKVFGRIPARNVRMQLGDGKEAVLAFEEGFRNVKRN